MGLLPQTALNDADSRRHLAASYVRTLEPVAIGAIRIRGYVRLRWKCQFPCGLNCKLINNDVDVCYDAYFFKSQEDELEKWISTLTRLFCLLFALTPFANAETIAKAGRFGGITIRYKIVLPNAYDPARAYPAILAFAGGRQNLDAVNNMLERNWLPEADARGYIIVSPIAPPNHFFFEQGADAIFPEFLDQILRDYKVKGGKLHIAGASNGGLSAFHIAAMYPHYFVSVTGFPGYLQDESESKMNALKPLCIYMHVGERDVEWLTPIQRQSELLRQRGLRVHFTIEPGEGHGIQTLAGEGARRLFDQIEQASGGCK